MSKLHLAIEGESLSCLIIGGGEAAAIKLRTLLDAGCRPSLLSPHLSVEVTEMVARHQLEHLPMCFHPSELTRRTYHLIVIATDDYELNRTIAAQCRESDLLHILTSDAEQSPVHSPATVHNAGITLSVYADGLPMLSRRLRDLFVASLPSNSEEQVKEMHRIRQSIIASGISGTERRTAIRNSLSPLIDTYLSSMDKKWIEESDDGSVSNA